MLNDDFAARGSFGELGLDMGLLGVSNFLHLSIYVTDLLLDFLVMFPCFFGRINSKTRSPREFLLNS